MKAYIETLVFTDETNHNTAIIEPVFIAPYYGAKKRLSYRLTLKNNEFFVYFVSCFETKKEAVEALNNYGDFK